MNVHFEQDFNKAQLSPFPHPERDEDLGWYIDAPQRFYSPYVIEVENLSGSTLSFHFLLFTDGSRVEGGPHTVDLSDETLVWREAPSTVTNANPGQCAFLFLQDDTLEKVGTSEMKRAAETSVGTLDGVVPLDTGKWPRSAALEEMAARALVTRLRNFLFAHPAAFTPEVRKLFNMLNASFRTLVPTGPQGLNK